MFFALVVGVVPTTCTGGSEGSSCSLLHANGKSGATVGFQQPIVGFDRGTHSVLPLLLGCEEKPPEQEEGGDPLRTPGLCLDPAARALGTQDLAAGAHRAQIAPRRGRASHLVPLERCADRAAESVVQALCARSATPITPHTLLSAVPCYKALNTTQPVVCARTSCCLLCLLEDPRVQGTSPPGYCATACRTS